MFNRVAARYDAANRVMSAGVDVVWRKKAITRLVDGLGDSPRLLDLGAGTLDGAREIVRRVPGARVAAADFARQMLRAGRSKIPAGAAIDTHAADGHHLPYRAGAFDGAFSAFCVRNLVDLPLALSELRRVVRPGGRVAILEFCRPEKTRLFFDKIWNARVLPLIGWAVTGDRAAYRYLPDSIQRFASLPELQALFRAAGFATVEGQPLFPSGIASLLVAS
jgi:ubiquinone/menaquinone biosynthesis methyltransferase